MKENEKPLLRRAQEKDLSAIIGLFIEDEFGAIRETLSDPLDPAYHKAFHAIVEDKNQVLLVVEYEGDIIGTCQLTFISSLSFKGSWRVYLENIIIAEKFRNQGIGTWMLQEAIAMGKERGCNLAQLTTHKKRTDAKRFYEKLGFNATHEGMKLELIKE